jgi:lysophospholipase
MLGLNLGRWPLPVVAAVAWAMGRLGRGASYAEGPGEPVGGRFEDSILAHDRRRWERTRALLVSTPEFQQGGATWGWLGFALQATARLARARPLGIPAAVVAAEDERLVDNAAARAYAARVGASYVEVPGAFHEVLMETEPRRAQVWAVFDEVARAVAPGR